VIVTIKFNSDFNSITNIALFQNQLGGVIASSLGIVSSRISILSSVPGSIIVRFLIIDVLQVSGTHVPTAMELANAFLTQYNSTNSPFRTNSFISSLHPDASLPSISLADSLQSSSSSSSGNMPLIIGCVVGGVGALAIAIGIGTVIHKRNKAKKTVPMDGDVARPIQSAPNISPPPVRPSANNPISILVHSSAFSNSANGQGETERAEGQTAHSDEHQQRA